MRKYLAAAAALVAMAACKGEKTAADAQPVPVIPAPASVERASGVFTMSPDASIHAEGGPEAVRIAGYFADLMRRTAGFNLVVEDADAASGSDAVRFELKPGDEPPGAYAIDVSEDAIVVSAGTPEGLFYGAVSLWQLATPAGAEGARIAAMKIEDAPGLEWRGVMLDSARHYQPPEFIKDFIDWMALHKLNVLHWHLTDDQAWRLEIKRYPKLTEIGAFRVPAGEAQNDIDPETGRPRLYGGYYTQEDVREIVAYAKARFVTIVPEIEMPGHAQATLVAYPELGVAAAKPQAVSADWGVFPYAYNVDEATFEFLKNVLAETAALFPGTYIHVGGDEVLKDQWRHDEAVQARMEELGVADAEALQGYFTARVDSILSGMGRRLVGWDEILEGGVSEGATVMSWRGVAGGIEAAKAGHDAILAPSPALYFDHWQSALPSEPPGRGGVVSLEDVYKFDPYPDELSDDERDHIIGVQGNLWTEHIRTTERVEHMAYPRLAALAEVAWAPEAEKDWEGFLARLSPMLERYEALGIGYATSAFEPKMTGTRSNGDVSVELSNQAAFGEIRYTLDGSAPTPASASYDGEFEAEPNAILTASTFVGGDAVATHKAKVATLVNLRTSQQLKTCEEKLVLNLEDDAPLKGERAVFLIDIMNPCWIFEDAQLTGVSAIEVAVGQLPFNFQIGDDIKKIVLDPPKTPDGELEIRADNCDGPLMASLPLAPVINDRAVTTLRTAIEPMEGAHDLCLTFTGREIDPMWAIDRIRLVRAP